MDEILLGLIESAGEKGITVTGLYRLLKQQGNVESEDNLKAHLHELKVLRKIEQVKFGSAYLYFTPLNAPSPSKTNRLIEERLQKMGPRLVAKATFEKEFTGPAKIYYADAFQELKAQRRVAQFKAAYVYLLHISAIPHLFSSISSADLENTDSQKSESSGLSWSNILSVYQEVVSSRGGLGAVPIGTLMRRLGAGKETFHRILLEEAKRGRATLHTANTTNLSEEEREGMLWVPESQDPFVTTTLRG